MNYQQRAYYEAMRRSQEQQAMRGSNNSSGSAPRHYVSQTGSAYSHHTPYQSAGSRDSRGSRGSQDGLRMSSGPEVCHSNPLITLASALRLLFLCCAFVQPHMARAWCPEMLRPCRRASVGMVAVVHVAERNAAYVPDENVPTQTCVNRLPLRALAHVSGATPRRPVVSLLPLCRWREWEFSFSRSPIPARLDPWQLLQRGGPHRACIG
jgi:hypothetical protein